MYDTEPVRGVGDGVDSAINMATQQEDDTGRENRLIRLLRLMRLLKLMRLVRFKRILDRWEEELYSSGFIKFGKLIIIIFGAAHWVACGWCECCIYYILL
eukprot:COSAG01_NODE_1409_length_10417_cov_4.920043_12_plen_100_part_00